MKTRAIAALALSAAAGAAHADVIPLTVFENHDGIVLTGLSTVVELAPTAGGVDLIFRNESTMDAVITGIYLESTAASMALLSAPAIQAGPGVAFVTGASPANPPGSIAPFGGAWAGTLHSFRAANPLMQKGIGPGEWLTLSFTAGESAQALTAAIAGGGFRIAQHVQGGDDGSSVWGTTVPAPGGAGVLMAGAVLAARRRRR